MEEYYPIYEHTEPQMKIDLDMLSKRPEKDMAREHEYLMLDVLKKALYISENLKPGDADEKEPDFVNDNKTFGLEMTWLTNRKGKSQIEGLKNGDFQCTDIDAVEWIKASIEKKAKKKYSIESISLATMFAFPIEIWTYPFCHLDSSRLSKLFYDINQNYIQNGIFKEIYIIIPTPNQKMTIYSLSAYDTSQFFIEPETVNWDNDKLSIL